MINIYINNSLYIVHESLSVLEACKLAGINIKRFCYHEVLSVSGNCRMCLVEIENQKVQASCVTDLLPEMEIYTDTPYVKKLRENILESLLINHPLDCPICDQGGECDLQDQAKLSGKTFSKFYFNKRGVESKNIGPLIQTIMTRCIQCTRCVRYTTEVCGNEQMLGTLGRGVNTEIGLYLNKFLNSEISGNVIDLCPVGALTARPYKYKSRPWELISEESIDLLDGLGSTIYFNLKQTEVVKILPKIDLEINNSFISDKTRFFFDALKSNRLKKIYYKNINSEILYKKFFFFKKQIFIVIDDNCSVDQLAFLKKLSFYDSRLKIVRKTCHVKNNFYVDKKFFLHNFFNKLKNICLIISSNLRFENSIINAKIRMKYNVDNINFFALNLVFNSTFPVCFVSLNIHEVCSLVEGKQDLFSNYIINNKLTLILGKYIDIRFSNLLNYFFTQINSNVNILTINLYSNTLGLDFMNINPIVYHRQKKRIVLCSSLDDILSTRLIFKASQFLYCTVWLNPFGSTILLKNDVLIPTEISYELKGMFINLEGCPQSVGQSFSGESSKFIKIFKNLFLNSCIELKKNDLYLNYLLEEMFSKLKINNFFIKPVGALLYSLNNIALKTGVFKSIVEDFYCSDLLSKNSKVLANCSQHWRKISNNFKL